MATENSTKITYDIYQKEHAKCKKHFHQMRIDIATQTSEIVNAVLRRMNDCILSTETYETRYDQTFADISTEYCKKKEHLKDLKQICVNVADNNPQPESTDMTAFTITIMDAIHELSQPPSLLLDSVPILKALNNSVRLNVRGQVIHPVYRTDPSLNIIEVPILKLAENPIAELAAENVYRGEKRPAGPLGDAVAAKRNRIEKSSGGIVAQNAVEIAGTKISHPFITNSTTPFPSTIFSSLQLPAFQQQQFVRQRPPPQQHFERQHPLPPPPQPRAIKQLATRKGVPPPPRRPQPQQAVPHQQGTMVQYPRIAPRVPSVANSGQQQQQQNNGNSRNAPIITFRPRGNLYVQQQQQLHPRPNAIATTATYIPPSYTAKGITPSSTNSNNLSKFPINLQIRLTPQQQQPRIVRPTLSSCSSSIQQLQAVSNGFSSEQQPNGILIQQQSLPLSNRILPPQKQQNGNLQYLPRVPIMPSVKKGSEDMQQALMDIVKPAAQSTKNDSSAVKPATADKPTPPPPASATKSSSKAIVTLSTSKSSDTVSSSSKSYKLSNESTSSSSSSCRTRESQSSSESSSQTLRRSARISSKK